jgi:hypothetical protein
VRDSFRAWYRPTDDELDLLWANAIIALDANVLLSPYRTSPQRHDRLFEVLEAHRDRVWCPHQAGLEFQRNRVKVAQDQRDEYQRIVRVLESAEKELTERRRDHPVLDPAAFKRVVQRSLSAIEREVRDLERKHPELMASDLQTDVVRDRWDELLAGRIGSPLNVDEEWCKQADARYAKKIPPGFEDQKRKEDGREYGDLILWHELLAHVQSETSEGEQRPVLFVTDDGKSDWWREALGRKLGPHVALTDEMAEVGGSPFWMYTTSSFVLEGTRRLGWDIEGLSEAAQESGDVSGEEPELAVTDKRNISGGDDQQPDVFLSDEA